MTCKEETQEHKSRTSFLVQRRDLPQARGFRAKIREEKEKKKKKRKNPTSIFFGLPFYIGWLRCPCRRQVAGGPACPESPNRLTPPPVQSASVLPAHAGRQPPAHPAWFLLGRAFTLWHYAHGPVLRIHLCEDVNSLPSFSFFQCC